VVGRKRQIAVDTGGRVIATRVTTGDVTDQDAGTALANTVCQLCPWVESFILDNGYKKGFRDHVEQELGRRVEVIKRPDDAKGFVLLPWRWKLEQTFGVLVICRRLRIDYETLFKCSTALLMLASIFRMVTSLTMP